VDRHNAPSALDGELDEEGANREPHRVSRIEPEGNDRERDRRRSTR
jgi:hypothetical protein